MHFETDYIQTRTFTVEAKRSLSGSESENWEERDLFSSSLYFKPSQQNVRNKFLKIDRSVDIKIMAETLSKPYIMYECPLSWVLTTNVNLSS